MTATPIELLIQMHQRGASATEIGRALGMARVTVRDRLARAGVLMPDPRRRPPQERFWSYVDKTETCWLWVGTKARGYGHLSVDGRMRMAHRLAYEWLVGPIPEGLHLDHLCRNRACVNPDHLEPVTCRENVVRGEGVAAQAVRKTHCKYGHEFSPENTRVNVRSSNGSTWRECLTCAKRKQAATDRRRREERRRRRAVA